MEETLDCLSLGSVKLRQAARGYRCSLDPVLLARFVNSEKLDTVVDLGTGSGILPLLLARLTAAPTLIGIELQPALARRARENVQLNQLAGRVRIEEGDVRRITTLMPAASADLVTCNPPYRRAGTGRVAPDAERALARHELAGGLHDFIRAGRNILKPGGRFTMIHLAERLTEILAGMAREGIEPKRLRLVHPRPAASARLVLVEGRRGAQPGLDVERPLNIYGEEAGQRDYSEEVRGMYAL